MDINKLQRKVYKLRRRLDPEVIEAEKRSERRRGLVKGLAIGSFLAGVTTLFLSPDSGANNRRKAKKELKKAKELLETNILEGREKVSKLYLDTKDTLGKNTNALKTKLNLNAADPMLDEEDIEELDLSDME